MSTTDLWNSRAALGPSAGTGDLIAAELERRYIAKYVKDGMSVLDVGCGNGTTARWLQQERRDIWIEGFDRSGEMVFAAEDLLAKQPFVVWQGDVLTMNLKTSYDLIYTQRCLINLPDWPSQSRAIERIISWLRPGGLYLAVECSQDGLDGINDLRAMVDLPAIVPPFHNRYLRDLEMTQLGIALGDADVAWLSSVESVCPTYSLLSRVINARLAADVGEEPRYDSEVNKLALRLPNVGSLGQNKAWAWRRCQ